MENVLQWSTLVHQIAPLWAITPTLALAIIAVESGGDPNIVTPGVDATGLMQVVPGSIIAGRPSIEELRDPRTNVAWGCYILWGYVKWKGNLYLALYQYSGGSNWDSFEDYERDYWLPVRRAQLEIEATLPASRPVFQ